ncbi:SDR family NAD(P)-dependent oxidoreductase [Cronobacter turicensis]|nr:SDR family NAD(P)-dependent oxidoreductase [Cronobacter turicensis]MDI7404412.1 SDR family NAD(P)-dependent oxidoreductase [Cronobacter turicensis]NHV08553.1 SDR family NAD(P)-dependent oxidoreductase [Cronobacter turicensis]NHV62561.1 SDR family NAD(P)-dependent oxidoreductase [Cronobacter turicensis]NHW09502.1 SDR family NAD(P)-dependent oxidoreductase [Cronobacter turicensis]
MGKNILITGGTSGIGLAGASRIVEEGGKVMVTGRDLGKLAMYIKRAS